jgi:hypothetical protein
MSPRVLQGGLKIKNKILVGFFFSLGLMAF